MIDYSHLNVHKLRTLVRQTGWKGATVLAASREELLAFIRTGECYPPFAFTTMGELVATLGIVREKPATQFQAQPGSRRTGRPAASMPDDTKPLLETFRNADRQGKAFYRTGKHGVFARRDELPEEFRQIGRDRLEKLIGGMLYAGEIVTTDGELTVPETFQECKTSGR